MAIIVQCPQGHRLTANDSNAGKTGRCPFCKAVVTIPMPQATLLSESSVLSILGAPDPGGISTNTNASKQKGSFSMTGSATVVSDEIQAKTKYCPSCEQEIDVGYHICPHCQTYMSALSDF